MCSVHLFVTSAILLLVVPSNTFTLFSLPHFPILLAPSPYFAVSLCFSSFGLLDLFAFPRYRFLL